jgi:hypothetical protein
MPARFVNIDRDTPLLLAPNLREWVADRHRCHFIVEPVAELDLRQVKVNERGCGSEPYPPSTLMALILYSCASGVFCRRRIEQAAPQKVQPGPKDQYNFTDPETRIMKAGNGDHFEQACNAQAAVEVDSRLIVGQRVSDAAKDKKQLDPIVAAIPEGVARVEAVLADSGFYSEEAVKEAEAIEAGEGVD